MMFPESALAHSLCQGKGIEIGGSAHNPFGLDTQNVDVTAEMTVYKQSEIDLCGSCLNVDIVASGDCLPIEDESVDFVVSSHVLEHMPDPIAALLEWDRVTRVGGTIFAIVPHKERTFDKARERTPLNHLIADWLANNREPHEGDTQGHDHVWITEDIRVLVEWMQTWTGVQWSVLAFEDTDDKVGNGFMFAVRKTGGRRWHTT